MRLTLQRRASAAARHSRFGRILTAAALGIAALATPIASQATPFTSTVPGTGVALPDEYPEAGGIVIVLTGVNGNVYYQFSDPDGAFVGFQFRGQPSRFRGNPFTINDPIALDCGFRDCTTYFGGAIARADIRFSAYDGDTQNGGFDENDISLVLNGFNVGSWSNRTTERTNNSGTRSFGFETGFGNNTFNTGWFSSTDPALLSNILSTGRTTTQVLDDDPNDNYWDFTRGNSLPDEELRTIAPGYELEKTRRGGSTTFAAVGEVVTYDYIVRNIGSVDINDISVEDDRIGPVSCNPTELEATNPGGTPEEATCTATYTVTQEDVDTQTLTNVALANGEPEFGSLGQLRDTVTLTGPAPAPAIEVEKTTTATDFEAGDLIPYTLTVSNAGNVTLTNVSVSDPLIPGLVCRFSEILPLSSENADNDEVCTGSYRATQADVDAFAIDGTPLGNTATARGTDPNGTRVTDTDSVALSGPAAAPALTVLKSAAQSSYDAVGDRIDYTITVTNTGNVTWPGPPTLTDDLTADESCRAGPVAPGDSIVCTASYTVTQPDLNDESVENTATASITVGGETATESDSVSVEADVRPGLEILKELASGQQPFTTEGAELVYRYTLRNTGNVTVDTASVSDNRVSVTCPTGSIAPGGTLVCTSDPYAITQTDIDAGSVVNEASASAQTEQGGLVESPRTTLMIEADQRPRLTLDKTAPNVPPASFAPGFVVTYSYEITNTGNTTITDPLTVSDDRIAGPIACPAGPLAPAQTRICTADYTVTSDDVAAGFVTNRASATDGTTTSNSDSESIPQDSAPALGLTKTADTPDFDAVGDTIDYTFTVTNTGDSVFVSQQTITINDPLVTDAGGTITCSQPATLFPQGSGDTPTSFTCSGTYDGVTQEQLDAGAVTNSATAEVTVGSGADQRTVTSPSATATVNDDVTPAFTFAKSVLAADGGSTFDALGEELVYTFTITNDTAQTLASVLVTDPLLPTLDCDLTAIAPFATRTCEGRYNVTQADLDAEQVTNTATAEATASTGETLVQQDSAAIAAGAAVGKAIELDKSVAPASYAAVGDTLTYTFAVENTGLQTVSGITVTDPRLGYSCTVATLAPGATDTSCTVGYRVTQADIDAGTVDNSATASAPDTPSDTDTAQADGPARNADIAITKQALDDYAVEGDIVPFVFTVENTGNVTLTSVVVTDPLLGPGYSCTIASLAPGVADTSCSGSYAVTQDDVDAGQFGNTATVNADGIGGAPLPPAEGSTTVTGPTEAPELTVEKSETDGTNSFGAVSTTETYDFVVRNTGNVTVTGITFSDPDLGFSCALAPLEPGDSTTVCADTTPLQATRTIDQADVDRGRIVNVATATGETIQGTPVSGDDTVTLSGPQQLPALTIAKTATQGAGFASVGETLAYDYVVTNSGNVTITSPIAVTDDRVFVSCPALPGGGLAPSASITCTATDAVEQADLDAGEVTNTASAQSSVPVVPSPTYPTGTADITSADDSATLSAAQAPAIAIEKLVLSGAPYSEVGDVVTFGFTVTNTGNVTITETILVVDTRISASTACGAVPLAPGEEAFCTLDYAVTQSDIDDGAVTNSAAAFTSFDGSPVTTPTPGEATAPALQLPELEATKEFASLEDSDGDPTTVFGPGNVITYDYSVTNTGNTTLDGPITVEDDRIGTFTCQPGDLDVGLTATCSATYTINSADSDVGSVSNSAVGVSGTDRSPPVSETVPVDASPALTIAKSAAPTTFSAAGQQITYTYTVTNSSEGNGGIRPAFTNPITVSDNRISGPIDCTPGDGQLDPDESTTCTAIYTIQQEDLDATQQGGGGIVSGFVTNVAGASTTFAGETVRAPNVSVTVDAATDPSLVVTKDVVSGPEPAAAGDTLTYRISTENDGNQTVSDVTVDDPLIDTLACSVAGGSVGLPITLAPTETLICDGIYTVTQDDIDAQSLTNTATVAGFDPDGGLITEAANNDHPLVDDAPAVTITKSLLDVTDFTDLGQSLDFLVTVENTGNVTLTSVEVTDSLVAGTCTIGPLAPGEVDDTTCIFTYVVAQEDIDTGSLENTVEATGTAASPDATEVEDDDTLTVAGPDRTPAIALVKTALDTAFATAGDVIDYEYTIANIGNVTLPDQPVLVDDRIGPVSCDPIPAGGLLPNDSITCRDSYEVLQADVDAGFVTNTADASATNPYGPPATARDTETVETVRDAAFTIAKTASPTEDAAVGDVITYSYVVENSGNVTLTDIALRDEQQNANGALLLDIEDDGEIDTLMPGETVTLQASYTVTQDDVDAGAPLTNVVTGTARAPPGVTDPTATDDASVAVEDAAPGLSVLKSIPVLPDPLEADAVLNFVVEVANTGNVTLTDVSPEDSLSRLDGTALPDPGETFRSGDAGTIGALDVGETWIYDVTYTLTQDDIDAGGVQNIMDVSATDPADDPVTDSSHPSNPADDAPTIVAVAPMPLIEAQKVLTTTPTAAGEVATFEITVSNLGNVTITDLVLDDTLTRNGGDVLTLDAGPDFVSATEGSVAGRLRVGETATYSASYTLTQDDVDAGGLSNSVTATGEGPDDDPVSDVSDDGDDSDGDTESDPTTIDFVRNADFTITKSASITEDAAAGDEIVYTYLVENTGTVTLTDITLEDTQTTGAGSEALTLDNGGVIPTLAPGGTASLTASYSVTQADIDAGAPLTNVVTGTATPPADVDPPDAQDELSVPLVTPAPALSVLKTATSSDTPPMLGSVIDYGFTVENTGNVTLDTVALTDALTRADGTALALDDGPDFVTADEGSPEGLLLVGETASYTGSYTLTQDDVDAGGVSNQATATATDPSDTPVSDLSDDPADPTDADSEGDGEPDDRTVVTIPGEPSLSVLKSVASVADTNGNGVTDANDVVTFDYTVSNPGNVTVFDVALEETGFTGSGPTPAPALVSGGDDLDGDGDGPDVAPGDTLRYAASYALTAADVAAGGITNQATAEGSLADGTSVTDLSDSATDADGTPISDPEGTETGTPDGDPTNDPTALTLTPPEPSLALVKSLSALEDSNDNGQTDAGDIVVFTFTAENTGATALAGLDVTDAGLPDVTLTVAPGFDGDLAVGEGPVAVAVGRYTLTQDDIDAGGIENSATIAATPVETNALGAPDAAAPLVDPATGDPYAPGAIRDTSDAGTDADGAAVADPAGTETPALDGTTDGDAGNDATPLSIAPVTGLELIKSVAAAPDTNGDGLFGGEGDVIRYAFTVTNSGTVTLSDVTITDPLVAVAGGPITLGAGASDTTSFTASYTVTAADIAAGSVENVATASGMAPDEAEVEDASDTGTDPSGRDIATPGAVETGDGDGDPGNDPTRLTVPSNPLPSLSLIKSVSRVIDTNGNGLTDPGDRVIYRFTVTNTGNIPLADIDVTDANATVSGGPITLDVGESDATSIRARRIITDADLQRGFIENGADVTGAAVNSAGDPIRDPATGVQLTATASSDAGTAPTPGPDGAPVPIADPFGTDSPDGRGVTDGDPLADVTVLLVPDPGLTVIKSVAAVPDTNGDGLFGGPGDLVTYRFTLRNSGNVVLGGLTVSDPLIDVTGGPIELAPGTADGVTFSGQYRVTQADIDRGFIENTASVSGTALAPNGTALVGPGGDPVAITATSDAGTAADGTTIPDPGAVDTPDGGGATDGDPTNDPTVTSVPSNPLPALALIKRVASVDDVNDNGRIDTGDVLSYAFEVRNTGNVALSDITVSDPLFAVSGTIATLDVQQTDSTSLTGAYTLTDADVARGFVENTAEASALAINGAGDPLIDPATGDQRGATATSDAGSITGPDGLPVTVASPLATETPDGAGATDGDPTNDPTVLSIGAPSLTLVKSVGPIADTNGDGLIAGPGDTLTYRFTVTNTGDRVLDPVVVTDPTARVSGGPIALAPGQSDTTSFAASYVITAADIAAGQVENSAQATGTLPLGGTIDTPSDTGTSPDGGAVSDPLTTETGTPDGDPANDPTVTTVPFAAEPGLTLVKSVVSATDDNGDGVSGAFDDTLTYAFTVTNTGNLDVSDIAISDPLLGGTIGSVPLLAPGDSVRFEVDYLVTVDDFLAGVIENLADAIGTPRLPDGSPFVAPGDDAPRPVTDVSDAGTAGDLEPIEDPGSVETPDADDESDGDAGNDPTVTTIPVAPSNASVSGLVFLDVNGDGVFDAGTDQGLGGYLVTLTNPDGIVIAQGITESDGTYLLEGFPFGSDYTLTFTDPVSGEVVQTITGLNFPPNTSLTDQNVAVLATDPPVISVTKAALVETVVIGQRVPYEIRVLNDGTRIASNLTVTDTLPFGLIFVPGSVSLDGEPVTPQVSGATIRIPDVSVPAGGEIVITLQAAVAPGAPIGEMTNVARVIDAATGAVLASDTATVERRPEAVFDCSDVIGRVFEDRNFNGYQDDVTRIPLPIEDADQPYDSKLGKRAPEPPRASPRGEPGLPGVRLSTATGTIITTDQNGLFSVPCAELPRQRGTNFTLKLDPRSLPTGYRVTTENPRTMRLTPGIMAEMNFGAAIGRVIDLDLTASAFQGNQPNAALQAGLRSLLQQVTDTPSVVRIGYYFAGEGREVAKDRIAATEAFIRNAWRGIGRYRLLIETEMTRLQ